MSDRHREDGAASRTQSRHKVFQPTMMAVHIARERVHLLDLSAHGALIHAAAAPAKGTVIRVECAGRMRTARVMWSDGSRFGVAFAQALSDDQVAATLAARPALGGRRPTVQAAALSMPSSPSLR